MTIFVNTLKRIFRNKIQVFFVLLFPLAFMSLGFIHEEQNVKAAIIDKDRTALTEDLARSLQSKADMRTVDEDEIEDKLMMLKVDYVVVIEKGFTDNVIAGRDGGISSYSVQESNMSQPVSALVNQWIGHAKTIAGAVKHEPEAFYKAFESYDQHGALQLSHRLVLDPEAAKTRAVIGYLVISMLYTSLVVGLHIIMSRANHTLYRTMAAPVRMRSYMLQTIGAFIMVSALQITLVMLLLKWVYGLYMDGSAWTLYLLLLLFSLVSVSFGVVISSFSKNMIQACLIGICLIAPFAMLGGAYFPLDWAPEIMRTMGQFTPVSWMMGGVEKLLQGQSLGAIVKEMSIIVLFAAIFFLLGALRRADIAK